MDIILVSEQTTKTQAFKLKGRLFTFTVLQVLNVDKALFSEQLAETVNQAPKLFERAPVVFDFSLVNQSEPDLYALCQLVRQYGMIPVALQGGTPLQETLAQAQGLALLNASTLKDKPIERKLEAAAPIEALRTKLLTTPVRSGQQVVSKGGDLIIAASVSPGAELLSDGHIHVYGTLRGRALAGISGNMEARIYCQSLEAELVSIAGFYRLSDAIESISGPCQIYLVDEHIMIEPL